MLRLVAPQATTLTKANLAPDDVISGALVVKARQKRTFVLFDRCLLYCKRSYGSLYARGQVSRNCNIGQKL